MLGTDDYVDVSEYVLIKKYKPIYCDTNKRQICKLIKNDLAKITLNHRHKLINGLIELFGQQYKNQIYIINFEKSVSYQYSYIIISDLVDVYVLNFKIEDINKKVYFRLD
ncbi:MAG: hypothetical protein QM535_16845, partial [Limnohabitans sp.]|nr:hypothetical protein [Limnohabitans sp.]